MVSLSRKHTHSAFGPLSSPLYYTTLSRLPTRLVCAGLPRASLCKLVLTSADSEAPIHRSLQANSVNGVCIWPLTAMPSFAEMLCTWRIEENPEGERLCSNNSVRVGAMQAPLPPREGRFHILKADSRDRLIRGQHRLMQVSDSNIASSANALFMAEFGLYHEALVIVDACLKSQTGHSSLLMARTVQALIYKQMRRQIEQEQKRHAARTAPLDWYNTWTINRERYHRELSIALMKGQCPRRCLKEVLSIS